MSIHIDTNNETVAEAVLLPGDPMRAKHIAENYLTNPVMYSSIRNAYGYTGLYKGIKVSVQTSGMGMPSMGIYSHELIHNHNAKRLIRVGTAGSFSKDVKLGDIVLVTAASTDSNYAHTFELNGTFAPSASWKLLSKAYDISKDMGLSIKAGNILSSDVFYELPENWWHQWEKMGVIGVEMEAAALYMNAAYAGVDALAIVTVTDEFHTNNRATTEQRTVANDGMIKLALNVAVD